MVTITTVKAASEGHGIKCLVYGSAGAGKTRLCGTAPSPLIISAEAGLLTLKKLIDNGELNPNTPVIEVKSITDVEEALELCKTTAKEKGIQTICLDSISEITEKCLANEKSKTKDPRAAYGEMANKVVELVKEFRDLPGFHVLVTAKQTSEPDPVTGVAKASPKCPGRQVGPDLPYLFDVVAHAYTDKDPTTGANFWALRTAAAFNVEAKDRSGNLDEIEYPSFTNMINKIMATQPPATS